MTRIEVTAEDIRGGEQDNSERCPVARALRRQGFSEARVFSAFVRMGHSKIMIPAAVGELIQLYDDSGEMEPFSFDLDATPFAKLLADAVQILRGGVE